MQEMFSTREIAEMFGVEDWRIRRLFEIGAVDETPRFAGRRVVSPTSIPAIAEALEERGWMPTAEKTAAYCKA